MTTVETFGFLTPAHNIAKDIILKRMRARKRKERKERKKSSKQKSR